MAILNEEELCTVRATYCAYVYVKVDDASYSRDALTKRVSFSWRSIFMKWFLLSVEV